MRPSYRIALSMLTIMILLTLTVGTSYSFYSVSDTQDQPNNLATTCFQITLNGQEGSSSIVLDNSGTGKYAYPMSDTDAEKLTPYTFEIKNTCTAETGNGNIKYMLNLSTSTDESKKSDSTLLDHIKYKLEKKNESGKIYTGFLKNTKDTLSEYEQYKLDNQIDKSYNLFTTSTSSEPTYLEIAPGATHTYDLRLWIDDTANNDVMGQKFDGQLLVYAYM